MIRRLAAEWELTERSLTWGKGFTDRIYRRDFPAGKIVIPGNDTEHYTNSFGMPHMAFVESKGCRCRAGARLWVQPASPSPKQNNRHRQGPAADRFTLQVDRRGDGSWTDLEIVGSTGERLRDALFAGGTDAVWLRLTTDRDCLATAFLHQTTSRFVDGGAADNKAIFAGLANVGDSNARAALIYAAKRNRNLRVITGDDRYFDFTKAGFEFKADEPDAKLKGVLHVEPEFTVDDASVVLKSRGRKVTTSEGQRGIRPPFASGWPRAVTRSRIGTSSRQHPWHLLRSSFGHQRSTAGVESDASRCQPLQADHRFLFVERTVGADRCSSERNQRRPRIRQATITKSLSGSAALTTSGNLGKPVGQGGPWFDSEAKAGVASDPYLMTGYDKKHVKLFHQSSESVSITLQIDIDGNGTWVAFRSFVVEPDQVVDYEFPTGFSACWVRAVSDRDTEATLTLKYQ